MAPSLGIDWLTLVFPYPAIQQLRDDVLPVLGGGYEPDSSLRRYGYSVCETHPTKAFVAYSPPGWNDSGRPEATWSLPGSYIAQIGSDGVEWAMRMMAKFGCSCSRIDIKWDDTERVVSLADIEEADRVRQTVGWRKPATCISRAGTVESMTWGNRGSAGSGRQLCVYDKAIESKGKIDAIRWEARFWGEKADQVYRALVDVPAGDPRFASLMGQFVAGSIDFRRRFPSGQVGSEDMRAPWYQKIRDLLGSSAVKVLPKDPMIDKLVAWVKSIRPALALVNHYFELQGQDLTFWADLFRDGAHEWGKKHKAILADMQAKLISEVQPLDDIPF